MLYLDALHLSPHIHGWRYSSGRRLCSAETDGGDGRNGDTRDDQMLLISASQRIKAKELMQREFAKNTHNKTTR